jgi:hypothetical protein
MLRAGSMPSYANAVVTSLLDLKLLAGLGLFPGRKHAANIRAKSADSLKGHTLVLILSEQLVKNLYHAHDVHAIRQKVIR